MWMYTRPSTDARQHRRLANRRAGRLAIACGVLALAGCASTPGPMSDQRREVVASRVYPDATVSEALDAVERLLRLADGDDFRITRRGGAVEAERDWTSWYFVGGSSGTDRWRVGASDVDGGVAVTAEVRRRTDPPPGAVDASGPAAPSSSDAPPESREFRRANGPALFWLFHQRMGYLLGETEDWYTCEGMRDLVESRDGLWGDLGPLCGRTSVQDSIPEALRASSD